MVAARPNMIEMQIAFCVPGRDHFQFRSNNQTGDYDGALHEHIIFLKAHI